MKNPLITGFIALAIAFSPAIAYAEAPLQAKPFFPFFSSEKESITPAPVQPSEPAPMEMNEETLDLNMLKSQPLPVRRQMVATELDAIFGRLSVLNDKTKAATVLLSENDIDTTLSETELAKTTLILANARLTIDSLIASSNDPANETVIVLLIGDATFKDTVIKSEHELRAARESIINALTHLKSAVSASVSAPVN